MDMNKLCILSYVKLLCGAVKDLVYMAIIVTFHVRQTARTTFVTYNTVLVSLVNLDGQEKPVKQNAKKDGMDQTVVRSV